MIGNDILISAVCSVCDVSGVAIGILGMTMELLQVYTLIVAVRERAGLGGFRSEVK